MDVAGKVVLITGASEGIGRAAAELLNQRGARVAVAARSLEKLRELAAPFRDGFAVHVDMTQPESITAMVDAVVQHYGSIDILINNAGRALRAPVLAIRVPDFEDLMRLNVYGPLLAMQAVVPHMTDRGGMILNISSNVSKMSIPTIGAYAATKYALNGLTLTARAELADRGIVVSLMHPAQTTTNFGRNALQYDAPSAPPGGGSNAKPDTAEQVAEQVLAAITSEAAEHYMSAEMERRFTMVGG